ncbi:MAG: Ig-like domain-containing protein, partial [Candidatus Pacearchaeota archaeon]
MKNIIKLFLCLVIISSFFVGNISSVSAVNPSVPSFAINSVDRTRVPMTIGFRVTTNGGSPITETGLVWSVNPNPTIANNKIAVGSSTGIFSTRMTDFIPGNEYFVRAYVINGNGIFYENNEQETGPSNMVLETSPITNITDTSATVGGNFISLGTYNSKDIVERGILWGTTPRNISDPNLLNNRIILGSGLGTFSTTLTNLNPNTTYYVSSYIAGKSGNEIRVMLMGEDLVLNTKDTIANQLQTISNNLETAGITNNLDSCLTTPTTCSGLYFLVKDGQNNNLGSITFDNPINLTSAATIAFLQNLNTNLKIELGNINLDNVIGTGFENQSARLVMYQIPISVSENDIAIYDVSGTPVMISGFNQTDQTVSFNVNHFTGFSVVFITSFNFTTPAVTGVITGTNIALTVPNETDLTNLIPTITLSNSVGTVAPLSGVANNFTTPQTYTVTNGDKEKVYTVTVTEEAGSDTTPPEVLSANPADGATSVSVNFTPTLTFSEALNPTTVIDTDNIELRAYTVAAFDATPVPATLSLSAGDTVVTITPNSPLENNKQYYFFIGTGVKDVAGNKFAINTWYHGQRANHEFTTEAVPLTAEIQISESATNPGASSIEVSDTLITE